MKLTNLHKALKLKLMAAFTLLLSSFSISAFADDVTFTASAPQAVEVGEQFRLQFVLNAKGSNFAEPNITDFQVLSGPNTSSSSSIQWINGSMSQSTTYTYTFILMADHEGKFLRYRVQDTAGNIKQNGAFREKNLSAEVIIANIRKKRFHQLKSQYIKPLANTAAVQDLPEYNDAADAL